MPQCFYQFFFSMQPTITLRVPIPGPTSKSIRFRRTSNDAGNLNLQLTCPRLEEPLLKFPMGGTNIQWDLNLHSMLSSTPFLILRQTPRLVIL